MKKEDSRNNNNIKKPTLKVQNEFDSYEEFFSKTIGSKTGKEDESMEEVRKHN